MKMVSINLDKKRTLKYGIKANIAIEKAAGCPFAKIDFEKQETAFILLYGGLLFEDKTITVEKVIDIVEEMVEAKVEEGMEFPEAMKTVMDDISKKVLDAMGIKGDKPDGLDALPKE